MNNAKKQEIFFIMEHYHDEVSSTKLKLPLIKWFLAMYFISSHMSIPILPCILQSLTKVTFAIICINSFILIINIT